MRGTNGVRCSDSHLLPSPFSPTLFDALSPLLPPLPSPSNNPLTLSARTGNYIGPDEDLESDSDNDDQSPQREQSAEGGAPPLREYDEDEAEPLEGMEVDGTF
jgi:hypothetical protein